MTVRIAIVADIHYGTDIMTKRAGLGLSLLQDFAKYCNDTKPDFVVDLGDRISDQDHDTDMALERAVAEGFEAISAPIRHICGNHDRDFLTQAENEAIFGAPMGHSTEEVGDWILVFFAADTFLHRPHGFKMLESDLLWLNAIVSQATKPLAIFSHVPVSGREFNGNYYFANNMNIASYAEAAPRVREILSKAKVPVTWVSGHVHCNTITQVDGIPHFTVQSLSESYTTHPHASGSYALLTLGDEIELQVFGADAFKASVPTRQTLKRWVPILPVQPEFVIKA